jgi:LuxR family maltose regulon positive regulatory protein
MVEERTEGWVTALQMIGIALQNRPDSDIFFRSFSLAQQEIQQYLLGEVLNSQDETTQNFLAHTAMLGRFRVPLVNHMMGVESSGNILYQILKKKLFVIPLGEDGKWYRYHHLFSELLKSRFL